MRVRVLLFAGLRERLGTAALSLELPASATVGDALARLREAHPELRSSTFVPARNETYAAPGDTLAEGDELALIPPVSGG